ncbi:hypothetical protein FE391_37200 [Nonomuraea sp. KC401]|uniref:hypothetical protein n=1 Tax=unclassified Nonomuraea TaxID=2593643 RepID=UPI0010FDAB62|nr:MULTISPECIES: hypothetical protein [unclassified Nonomuraea]NBE98964.1 hypothetical protein [Nonomuraea sp. K271]TLF57927.1 hypothetical protein FE391_37200 [Nonomuraea sp. KC401]
MKDSRDELKVPSQRADEVRGDDRDAEREAVRARPGEHIPGGPVAGDDAAGIGRRPDEEYDTAVPGAVTTPEPDEDAAYRDPYATTGDDLPPEPEPAPLNAEAVPDEVPAHAAPQDVILFDQDPAQVQARWRDLQASFVDDPGEAVRRADGLLGEVVEAFTSSLTSRTDTLRDGWKDAGAHDTELLRLALRDYRNVLEHLLALSGAPGQSRAEAHDPGHIQGHVQGHSQGMR